MLEEEASDVQLQYSLCAPLGSKSGLFWMETLQEQLSPYKMNKELFLSSLKTSNVLGMRFSFLTEKKCPM